MLFGMFDDASLWGDRVRLEHRVFSTRTSATRTRSATSESTAMRGAFIGLVFFSLTAGSGALPAKYWRRLRSERFAGKAVAGRTNALLQRQQAGFKSQAGCTSGPRSLPLSSAAAYASNHPTTPPMSPPSQPVAPASQTWTGFYIRSGSWRGPSITARSAGADEDLPGMRADAPVHVDEALRAAINRHQERWSAKRLQTAIFGLRRL